LRSLGFGPTPNALRLAAVHYGNPLYSDGKVIFYLSPLFQESSCKVKQGLGVSFIPQKDNMFRPLLGNNCDITIQRCSQHEYKLIILGLQSSGFRYPVGA
jgi:hypothetical protein